MTRKPKSQTAVRVVEIMCLHRPRAVRSYGAAFTAAGLAAGFICVKCGRKVSGKGDGKHRVMKR